MIPEVALWPSFIMAKEKVAPYNPNGGRPPDVTPPAATDPAAYDATSPMIQAAARTECPDADVLAKYVSGSLIEAHADRLLGAHEERAEAEARARESQRAMTAMATGQQRMVRELAEERYERQRVNDRFRDERTARMLTDAKLAELRARLDHETAAAERERIGRLEASQLIGRKLAGILSGGAHKSGPSPRVVSEQTLLDLEREAFLSLCGERKSLERVQHMLKTGKPLRN